MHIKLHKASRTSKYRSRGETVHAIVEFKKKIKIKIQNLQEVLQNKKSNHILMYVNHDTDSLFIINRI